ncbi:MAG: tetratricopeptide repeat protein [Burkholderiales bacterium]|jgi:predicted negative regulator of RcsB-dependent stress response|nr:tetratricopeptide repeat protein [Burkholderiales bacterium]
MAVYDHQEREQIEDLKVWWNQWGGYLLVIIMGILLVILSVQGWRMWNAQRSDAASTLYFALSEAIDSEDATRAKEAMAQLADNYGSTGYAPRAALLYAEALWSADKKDEAQTQLQWVIDRASEDDLKQIARYRLAELLIDQQKYEDALRLLDAKHKPAYEALYADLRGDALFGAGRTDEAREAYQKALLKLSARESGSAYHNIVQIKLDGLGGPIDPIAAVSADISIEKKNP